MNFMKKGRIVAAIAATVLAFTACAPAADSGAGDDKITIGATFPVLDAFLQKVADGIQAEADAQGAELTIVAADNKVDTQLSQVENFISQGVDAILVVAVDTSAAGPMTEAAKAAGKTVYHLNIGQPDIETPEVVREKMKALDIKVIEYSNSDGIGSYKKGLTGYYASKDIALTPQQLMITTGGSEALIFTFVRSKAASLIWEAIVRFQIIVYNLFSAFPILSDGNL